jgi:uncharacterized protein (DUF2164 family)
MKKKFDIPDVVLQRKCIEEVITRIEQVDTDQVGIITAQEIIDIVVQNLGPAIYNMGLFDAKKLLQEQYEKMESELDVLEQQ